MEAVAAGCDVAVVTTQPGSKSQENVQRRGFHLLYTRVVLVKKARGRGTIKYPELIGVSRRGPIRSRLTRLNSVS